MILYALEDKEVDGLVPIKSLYSDIVFAHLKIEWDREEGATFFIYGMDDEVMEAIEAVMDEDREPSES